MGRIGEVRQLRRGAEVLRDITITDVDFPWLSGTFAARAGFASVASLFAEEHALAQVIEDDDSPAVEEA